MWLIPGTYIVFNNGRIPGPIIWYANVLMQCPMAFLQTKIEVNPLFHREV